MVLFGFHLLHCAPVAEAVSQRPPAGITCSHTRSLTFVDGFEALRADGKVCGEPQGQYGSAAHYRRRQQESRQPEEQTNKGSQINDDGTSLMCNIDSSPVHKLEERLTTRPQRAQVKMKCNQKKKYRKKERNESSTALAEKGGVMGTRRSARVRAHSQRQERLRCENAHQSVHLMKKKKKHFQSL